MPARMPISMPWRAIVIHAPLQFESGTPRRRVWLATWGEVLVLALALALAGLSPTARAQGLPDFTELVERVGPAVVGIRTTERTRSARGGSGSEMDEDMLEFFRRFGLPIPNRPNPRSPQGTPTPDAEPQTRGVGSGFILNADG